VRVASAGRSTLRDGHHIIEEGGACESSGAGALGVASGKGVAGNLGRGTAGNSEIVRRGIDAQRRKGGRDGSKREYTLHGEKTDWFQQEKRATVFVSKRVTKRVTNASQYRKLLPAKQNRKENIVEGGRGDNPWL